MTHATTQTTNNNGSNNTTDPKWGKVLGRWSLKEFEDMHKETWYSPDLVNSKTGQVFHMLGFVAHDGEKHGVFFAKNLGDLTKADIKKNRNDLDVIELEPLPQAPDQRRFILCGKAFAGWQKFKIF